MLAETELADSGGWRTAQAPLLLTADFNACRLNTKKIVRDGSWWKRGRARWLFCCLGLAVTLARGADPETQKEVRELRQENRELKQQLSKQQQLIESLSAKVSTIEEAQKAQGNIPSGETAAPSGLQKLSGQTKVSLSGQLAAGFFWTDSHGAYPKGTFLVDEARLFLDMRAWEDVYGFVELDVMTRENGGTAVQAGEAYLDLERLVKWNGLDSLVNIRLGRFYTPYGEEYAVRNPMENPLITHSLMDFWGVDAGLELYGSQGPFQYAFTVQNGGVNPVNDFTADKSLALRLTYEPKKWLHLSASGMRTGELSVNNDQMSAMWFGNGFFRSIGDPASTHRFHADMVEGDVEFLFPRGHLKLAGGAAYYDDNDKVNDNRRDIYYYSAEGLFRFNQQFYAAARFSQIFADGGYPIIGNGTWGEYFYSKMTEDIWRLSLGFGYTPNPNLTFKIEYAIERGHTTSGEQRNREDFFGAQAAIRF
jgi:hypothetical protein